jgi:SAM-dependent methyltransferase
MPPQPAAGSISLLHPLPPNPRKTRGLDDLERRIGPIAPEIDRRLRQGSPVRILEIGCGYGAALLDLLQRYGARVALHGVNKTLDHGNPQTLHALFLRSCLLSACRIQLQAMNFELRTRLPLPRLHTFDVCAPWPFPDGSFDLVFSQHTFLWLDDKIQCLEEIHRVLAPGGIALLDLRVSRTRSPRKQSIVIRDSANRPLSFHTYLRRFPNIRLHPAAKPAFHRLLHWLRQRTGRISAPATRRPCFEVRTAPGLDFRLEFLASRSYPAAHHRKGRQSIYQLRP